MTAVYLTTYLPATFLRSRVRRRRKIAVGELIRIGLAPLLDPRMSDECGGEAPTLFVDGTPVAFVNPFSSGEWHTVDGSSGTGLAFVPVAK